MNKRELVITRVKQNANKARAIEIYINNKMMGTIKNGETKTFKVDSAINKVYAKIDWCKTTPITINTNQSQITRFELGSTLTGWKLFLGIYYILFKTSEYLYLRLK